MHEKLFITERYSCFDERKILSLSPKNQIQILNRYKNGGNITYKNQHDFFHLPELEQNIQALLEDMSRKKLSLTAREWEVCKGLARGETAKETALILGIQHRTVQTHLDKIVSEI